MTKSIKKLKLKFQLAHPILHSLRGTPNEWACELVKAVSVGDVGAFERIRAKSNCDELHKADRQLRQKIAILCLMEVCQYDSNILVFIPHAPHYTDSNLEEVL